MHGRRQFHDEALRGAAGFQELIERDLDHVEAAQLKGVLQLGADGIEHQSPADCELLLLAA